MLKDLQDTRPLAFSHVPKTGGKSINQYIEQNNLNVRLYQHRRFVEDGANFRTFAMVRHPYTRYVSAINYALYIHEQPERLVRSILGSLNRKIDLDVVDLFTEDFLSIMNIFTRQTSFLSRLKIDCLYKYEDGLEKIVADLKECFTFDEVFPLPRINVSKKTYTVDMLTKEHKRKLNEWYSADFETYNYEKEE